MTSDFRVFSPRPATRCCGGWCARSRRSRRSSRCSRRMRFGKAAKGGGQVVLSQRASIWSRNPVETLSAIPDGIASIFEPRARAGRPPGARANTRTTRRRRSSPYRATSGIMPRRSGSMHIRPTRRCRTSWDRLAWGVCGREPDLGRGVDSRRARVVLQVASNVRTLETGAQRDRGRRRPASSPGATGATLHRLGVPDAVTGPVPGRPRAVAAASDDHRREHGVAGQHPGPGRFSSAMPRRRGQRIRRSFFQQAAELLAGYSAVVSRNHAGRRVLPTCRWGTMRLARRFCCCRSTGCCGTPRSGRSRRADRAEPAEAEDGPRDRDLDHGDGFGEGGGGAGRVGFGADPKLRQPDQAARLIAVVGVPAWQP